MMKGFGSIGWILIVVSVLLALMNTSLVGEVVHSVVPSGTTDNTPAVDKAKELASENVTAPLWLWIVLFVVVVIALK